jgi:23S rRNA pseudouridine2605 synthase
VEQLVLSGRVSLNGAKVQDLGLKVNPTSDRVLLDGKEVKPLTEKAYLMLNKPRGYVVTQSDELERNTVYALLPDSAAGLSYAGRLDKNSEGLLLFTNDGELINRLTHPKGKVEKVYRADIDRPLGRRELEQLRRGVVIEGGKTRPAGVFVKSQSENAMSLKLVITEGRKRQIRQMIEAVGAKVRLLRRLQFGTLRLGDLPPGRWRPLTQAEVRALKKLTETPKP